MELINQLYLIGNSIRNKTGGTNLLTIADMLNEIDSIPSGEVIQYSSQDVVFYDYDGSILKSYSLSDLPLESLPSIPDHTNEKITFSNWSLTLEEVNLLTQPTDVYPVYTSDYGLCLYLDITEDE